jgi:integrase
MEYRIDRELVPKEDHLANRVVPTVIKPAEAAKLLEFVWQHKNDSVHAAYSCMIFHILFWFGFRASEILGLRKSSVNLEDCYVDISGMFDTETYTFRNKTKNKGSKRKVYFDANGDVAKKLRWIVAYSNKHFPANDFLIAATRGNSPLSPYMFRKVIYATYEILGLAKMRWFEMSSSNNSKGFEIIWCPFKGCISKTWRHLKAAQLIQSKNVLQLSEDHIKRVMGHDLYSTTAEIYGNHDLFSKDEHQQLAAKIEKYRNNNIKLLS